MIISNEETNDGRFMQLMTHRVNVINGYLISYEEFNPPTARETKLSHDMRVDER